MELMDDLLRDFPQAAHFGIYEHISPAIERPADGEKLADFGEGVRLLE